MQILKKREYSLLNAIDEIKSTDKTKEQFATLYYILDILDAKTAALLTFNGIIIAAFTILATEEPYKIILLALMLFPIWACIICFKVVSISWPFLFFGKGESQNELQKLSEVVDTRTKKYQNSWLLSVISFGALILGIMIVLIDSLWDIFI